jgi:predicted TIM-barrel fold metal-dependent hydrolase
VRLFAEPQKPKENIMNTEHLRGIIAALALTAVPVGAQEHLPIIDMHLHAARVAKDSAGQPIPRPGKPEPCEHAPAVAKDDADVLRLTLEAMDCHNIVLGFLSSWRSAGEKWIDAAPQRFIPAFQLYDPTTVDLAALRTALKTGKVKAIGELCNQYMAIPPNDPVLDPVFALAAEFDVPVLIHCSGTGDVTAKNFRIARGHPELLQDVLIKYPTLRLCIAHGGFPFFEETAAILYHYPNVYLDLSAINWIIPRSMFHRYLRDLIDAGLSKRIMFGSDQMGYPEAIDLAIAAIESAEFLTPEQKRDIFYNNAARFLRLRDVPKASGEPSANER